MAAIPTILKGDDSGAIQITLATGHTYTGATLIVAYQGVTRSFTNLSAGQTLNLSFTHDETATFTLKTAPLLMRLIGQYGAEETLENAEARIKTTDCLAEVNAGGSFTVKPGGTSSDPTKVPITDVGDMASRYTLADLKAKVDQIVHVLAQRSLLSLSALLLSTSCATTCLADIIPQTARLDALYNDSLVVTNVTGSSSSITTNDVKSISSNIVQTAIVPITNDLSSLEHCVNTFTNNVYTKTQVDSIADETLTSAKHYTDDELGDVYSTFCEYLPLDGSVEMDGDLHIGVYNKLWFLDVSLFQNYESDNWGLVVSNGYHSSTLTPDSTPVLTAALATNTFPIVTNAWTKAEADGRYLKTTGGKVTGDLSIAKSSSIEFLDSGNSTVGSFYVDEYTQSNGVLFYENGHGALVFDPRRAYSGLDYVTTDCVATNIVNSLINHTLPHFSNEVLAVALNIDTNSVAVLNEIAATFGGFPITGTATTLGGLLAALVAALTWLKTKKQDKLTAGTGISIASNYAWASSNYGTLYSTSVPAVGSSVTAYSDAACTTASGYVNTIACTAANTYVPMKGGEAAQGTITLTGNNVISTDAVRSFSTVGTQTPTVENGVADLTSLFTSDNRSLANTMNGGTNAILQAGSNITLTQDATTGKVTIAGTGGGTASGVEIVDSTLGCTWKLTCSNGEFKWVVKEA